MRFQLFVPMALSLAWACGSDDAGPAANAPGSPSTPASDAGTSEASSETGDSAPAATCTPPTPSLCLAAPPAVGLARPWRHGAPALGLGSANHRGRDAFVNPGYPQWVIGHFAYGKAIAELKVKDEDVDVWLNRDCGAGWEKLGTVATTDAPTGPAIEGVADDAGRVFFQIPAANPLGVGRHRVRMVMAGDLTFTELFIEVVEPNTPIFVSDVDGTLTTSETAEFNSLLTGALSAANDGAPEALSALAARGYRPMYLTARPEWLVERTREFVRDRGFPPGIIHTTTSGALPANGTAAIDFKSGELAALKGKGLTPSFVFGNTDTDASAYDKSQVQPVSHRLFFQFGEPDGGLVFGGRRFESYRTLLSDFLQLAPVCP